MALKTCTVVVHDLNETEHSLDVTAETLYEAIAQALAALRGQDWVGEIGKGLTTVTVKVRHPEVTHVVKIQDFENWLKRGCKSPAEIILKTRLQQMLGMTMMIAMAMMMMMMMMTTMVTTTVAASSSAAAATTATATAMAPPWLTVRLPICSSSGAGIVVKRIEQRRPSVPHAPIQCAPRPRCPIRTKLDSFASSSLLQDF